MTSPDAELRARAVRPETKGRWRYRRSIFDAKDKINYAYVEWGEPDFGYGTGTLSQAMGRYIAAASPDRVLALLDRAAALAARVGELEAALRSTAKWLGGSTPACWCPLLPHDPRDNHCRMLRAALEGRGGEG